MRCPKRQRLMCINHSSPLTTRGILLSVLVLVLIAATVIACSDKVSETPDIPSFEVIGQTKIDEVAHLSYVGENIILVGRANYVDNYIYVFDSTGEMQSESKITLPAYLKAADVDDDGNVWLYHNVATLNFETYEAVFDSAYVDCYDTFGNLIRSIELDTSNVVYAYALANNNKLIVSGGNFYISSSQSSASLVVLFAFDESGALKTETNNIGGNYIDDMCRLSDRRLVLKTFNPNMPTSSAYLFEEFDLNRGSNRAWQVDADTAGVFYNTGYDSYPLLKCTSEAILGYNIETMESTSLVMWDERGVDGAVYQHAIAIDDEYVFSLMKSSENGTTLDLIKLPVTSSGIPHNTTADKTTVVVGGIGGVEGIAFENMRREIRLFNETNLEYRLELKDYFETDYNSALTRLNLDIISGNAPDVILFNDVFAIPRDNYANMGLFADLYEFIDSDPDIKREDFLPNVFKALETDGRLYFGATSFHIMTLVGKTSEVGTEMGWTWDDYDSLIASQPQGITPIAAEGESSSKVSMFLRLLSPKLGEYVDYKTGTCDFVNSDFVKLLEVVDDFDNDTIGYSRAADFSEDNPLLMLANMFGFHELMKWEKHYFNDDVTFIGVPSNNGGSGSTGRLFNTFAISASSEAQDGAWAFAKYLMLDSQERMGTVAIFSPEIPRVTSVGFDGYPIKISELQRIAEFSKIELEADDDRGVLRSEYILDGADYRPYDVQPNTDREVDKVLDLIYSVSFSHYETTVRNIVVEEIDNYFYGHRTAEDVAAIIQSRVSLYLAERE